MMNDFLTCSPSAWWNGPSIGRWDVPPGSCCRLNWSNGSSPNGRGHWNRIRPTTPTTTTPVKLKFNFDLFFVQSDVILAYLCVEKVRSTIRASARRKATKSTSIWKMVWLWRVLTSTRLDHVPVTSKWTCIRCRPIDSSRKADPKDLAPSKDGWPTATPTASPVSAEGIHHHQWHLSTNNPFYYIKYHIFYVDILLHLSL